MVQRPWYKKKRFLLPIGFVALLLFIGALNGASVDAPTAGGADGSSADTDGRTADEVAAEEAERAAEVEAAAQAQAEAEAAAAAEAERATAAAAEAAAAASAAAAAAEAAAAYGEQPTDQVQFVEIVVAAQEGTAAADNDLQVGAIKAERDQALCGLLQSKDVTGWTGRLTEIDANNGGKGVLTIEIADDVEIMTWNNAFSDFADDTLIEPSTPVFDAALTLTEGQVVRFSGTLIDGGSDCLRESSLTLEGGLETPSFIFRFSDLAAG